MNADALRIEVDSVEVHHLTMVGTVPGVVPLLAAARNGSGIGKLLCGDPGTLLSWRAPGSETFGDAFDCSTDGTYVLCDGEDPDKWIRVSVRDEYAVAGSQADVLLADVYNNAIGGEDVTEEEAEAGCQTVWNLTLRNAGDEAISAVLVWCGAGCDPGTELSVDGTQWSRPTTEAEGVYIAQLDAGETAPLHVRRTIGAGETCDPKRLVHLDFAFSCF